MKGKLLIPLAAAWLCLAAAGAVASSGEATQMVRKMLDEAMAIQNNPALQGQEKRATRKAEIKKVILANFDFDGMSRQALGQYYKSLDGKKQAEFKSVFQDLFLDSYSRLVLDFLKKETIVYTGEKEDAGRVTVNSLIKRPGEEIPVDYFVAGAGGSRKVDDVSVDGVSIVGNYRQSFGRIIKQEGYGSLIKKMKLQQQAEAKG